MRIKDDMKSMFKNAATLAAAALCLCATASCSSDEPGGQKKPEDPVPPSSKYSITLTAEQKKKVAKSNKSAIMLWNEISSRDQDNKLFSPLSLQMSLSMLANGADGETLDRLVALFSDQTGNDGLSETNELNKLLLAELPKVDSSVKTGIANSVWIAEGMTAKDPFRKACEDFYAASLHAFIPGTEETRTAFNKWCNDKTEGMIPDFFDEAPDFDAIIANASYFKGVWERSFNPDRTHPSKFYCASGKTADVKMMRLDDGVDYGSNETFEAVRLYYGNRGYSMTLILPKDRKAGAFGAVNLEEALDDNFFMPSGKFLEMPRFESECKMDDILEVLDRLDIIDKGTVFRNIIADGEMVPSRVIQKTRIKVDEEGTEAAGASATGAVSIDASKTLYFSKPFIYIIREESTGALLFIGRVMEF